MESGMGPNKSMMQWNLDIALKSDMCAGSGDSAAGLIDIKTVTKHGIPEIPAKRLKGCLLQAGKEMRDNGVIAPDIFSQLFGSAGAERPGRLRIRDARLVYIPEKIVGKEACFLENYEEIQKELADEEAQAMAAWLERQLTGLRTRTAVDEKTGTAKDNTLRTMQIVPKGMRFRSIIDMTLSPDARLNDEMEEALRKCVKALRHIGVGITRGLGVVECMLEDCGRKPEAGAAGLESPVFCRDGQEVEAVYELELKAPLLFAGKDGLYEDCSDQIPGSALLGAFAGMVIQDLKLGRNAHEDETFQRIFLKDGVKFGYGFLERAGQVFYPCPAALAREKEENRSVNLLCGEVKVRRKEIGSQVSGRFGENKIYLAETEKEIRMHHARPEDRSIAHALNDWNPAAGDNMGQFYQYTCLSMGQRFRGTIKGKAEDIRLLAECLARRQGRFYLGRSRSAEYGEVELRWIADRQSTGGGNGSAEEKANRWLLWLVTPCVIMNMENGAVFPDMKVLTGQLKEKYGLEFPEGEKEKGRIFLKYAKVGGYNSKWGLPCPQYPAFGPGTLIEVQTGQECRASDLENIRLGEFTGKGYGQFIAVAYDKAEYMWSGCSLEKDLQESDKDLLSMEDGCCNPSKYNFLTPFLRKMDRLKQVMEKQQKDKKTALEAFNKIMESNHKSGSKKTALPNMRTLYSMMDLADREKCDGNHSIDLEVFCSKLNKEISDKGGRNGKGEKVKAFLEDAFSPFGGRVSADVLEYFLEYTKWEVRKEGKTDE